MSRNQNNGNPNNIDYDLDMREQIIPLDILYPLCGFLCCLFRFNNFNTCIYILSIFIIVLFE